MAADDKIWCKDHFGNSFSSRDMGMANISSVWCYIMHCFSETTGAIRYFIPSKLAINFNLGPDLM